jgi:hypothetical protein
MDKEYFNILIFDHIAFGNRNLRIKKDTFKILIYLLAFFQLTITFFLCDYIQVKKKSFSLNQLRLESQNQKSQIQLFSAKIEEIEEKLSKLKGIDRRIRIIANLQEGDKVTPFIAIGGSPSSANSNPSPLP